MARWRLNGGTAVKDQLSSCRNGQRLKMFWVFPLGGCCQGTQALEREGLIIRNRIATGSASSSLDCEHAPNNGARFTPDFLRHVIDGLVDLNLGAV